MCTLLRSIAFLLLFAMAVAPASSLGQTPHIMSVHPAQNASNVTAGANIYVIFDTPMDGVTINNGSFVVNSPLTGVMQGTVNYDDQVLTAEFEPAHDFKPGEVVSVVLTTDITSSSGQPLAQSYSWRFTVIVGAGGGTFELHATYPLDFAFNYALCAADFDRNGSIDLATTSREWSSQTVGILLNDGAGGFLTPAKYDGGKVIHGVSAADFNSDGFPDLVTCNDYCNTITILMNHGDGTFGFPTSYAREGNGRGTTVGDFDGDGDIDVAAAGDGTISVLMNDGSGIFDPCVSYVVGDWLENLVAADFNADGFLDLATGDCSYNLKILLNGGDGTFGSPLQYPAGGSCIYGITTADFDNDRSLDVVATDALELYMSVMTNNSSGFFQLHFLVTNIGHCYFPMAGDLDADGDQDIMIQVNHNELYTYFNYGDATFERCAVYLDGTDPTGVALADFDGDGDLDWVVADSQEKLLRVFYNVDPHPCPPLQTPRHGSIAGTITADCPAPNTGLLGVAVDVFEVGSGELVGSAITDDVGHYQINDLVPGDYIVSVVVPLGYSYSVDEIQVTVIGGDVVMADFALHCVDITAEPRTIGFWKHQVGVATGGKGTAQIDVATLCYYLDLIAAHFNGNELNQVVVYTPPSSTQCVDKLYVALDLLNLKGNVGMTARARQQLTALLLNAVSGKISQTQIVSADGATLSQAITYCDQLIDDPAGDHEKAKTICDLINNNIIAPAEMIPLATRNIAYKTLDEASPQFCLYQSYPNPFNPVTNIEFALPSASDVQIEVFNISGQRVRELRNGRMAAGTHTVTWDGTDMSGIPVSSGIYLYRIHAGDFIDTKKMVLLK